MRRPRLAADDGFTLVETLIIDIRAAAGPAGDATFSIAPRVRTPTARAGAQLARRIRR